MSPQALSRHLRMLAQGRPGVGSRHRARCARARLQRASRRLPAAAAMAGAGRGTMARTAAGIQSVRRESHRAAASPRHERRQRARQRHRRRSAFAGVRNLSPRRSIVGGGAASNFATRALTRGFLRIEPEVGGRLFESIDGADAVHVLRGRAASWFGSRRSVCRSPGAMPISPRTSKPTSMSNFRHQPRARR